MRISGFLIAALLIANISARSAEPEVRHFKTRGGVEYGVWGKATGKPTPILFVLAGTIDGTLGSAYFRQCGNQLAEHGYVSVSIDIPCHGSQTGEGKPSGLGGWGERAAKGEDFVAECNARLSEVLDHLIKTGVADPEKIAICGTSRGGFLAIQFAAQDERVDCAAAFAPVTDLAALSEFKGKEDLQMTKQLSLVNQSEKLAGRSVWIVIGDQDARVGTQKAIDLAGAITSAAEARKLEDRVKLHVLPEPRGHTTPEGAPDMAAKWILEQMKIATAAPKTASGFD